MGLGILALLKFVLGRRTKTLSRLVYEKQMIKICLRMFFENKWTESI